MSYEDEDPIDLCDVFTNAEDTHLSQGAACLRGYHAIHLRHLHQTHAECQHCGELVYLDE